VVEARELLDRDPVVTGGLERRLDLGQVLPGRDLTVFLADGSISLRILRNAIPARTSPAKSSLVEDAVLPLEPPTPRSSTRSTAIPWRVSVSARTRNDLCSKSVSSRSCAPEPLIKINAGNGLCPSGSVNVPARVTPPVLFW